MADFSCRLTLDFPFPTPRLAAIAMRALGVDAELSPLVRRSFSTVAAPGAADAAPTGAAAPAPAASASALNEEGSTVLRAEYAATTDRMLRVAVNSFLDSLQLVMEVMEKLDVDMDLEDVPDGSTGQVAPLREVA